MDLPFGLGPLIKDPARADQHKGGASTSLGEKLNREDAATRLDEGDGEFRLVLSGLTESEEIPTPPSNGGGLTEDLRIFKRTTGEALSGEIMSKPQDVQTGVRQADIRMNTPEFAGKTFVTPTIDPEISLQETAPQEFSSQENFPQIGGLKSQQAVEQGEHPGAALFSKVIVDGQERGSPLLADAVANRIPLHESDLPIAADLSSVKQTPVGPGAVEDKLLTALPKGDGEILSAAALSKAEIKGLAGAVIPDSAQPTKSSVPSGAGITLTGSPIETEGLIREDALVRKEIPISTAMTEASAKAAAPEIDKETQPLIGRNRVEQGNSAALAAKKQLSFVQGATEAKAAAPLHTGMPVEATGSPIDISEFDEIDTPGREFRRFTMGDAAAHPVLRREHTAYANAPTPTLAAASGPVIVEGDISLGESEFDPSMDLMFDRRLSGQHLQLASTAAATPVTQANPANAAAQIVAAVKMSNRNDKIEVRLDPPEMGRVRIDFSVDTQEAVRAVLTAERSETLDYLRRNPEDLEAKLREAGFTSVDLTFADSGENEFSNEHEEAGSASFMENPEGAMRNDREVVYLSMRDGAQLDLLA